MDCCSSNYMEYRHSINNNFCYPYSPGMIRGASPYPVGGPAGSNRYDYRGGYYDSFEKYYDYHSGPNHGYGGHYYGNYSSFRDFSYNDYYHGASAVTSPSHPLAGLGAYHGPHIYNRQSLPFPFQRESAYQQRDHHQYANFSNYSGNPYKADTSDSTTSPLANSNNNNNNSSNGTSNNSRNNGDCSLFGVPNGYTHSPEYSYGSGSPNHSHHHLHPHHSPGEDGGMGRGYPSAVPNATGFPPNIKDARMRKLKERKLVNKSPYCNSPNGGQNSVCSSPNPGSSGSSGSNSNGNVRLKSVDALPNDKYDQEGIISSPSISRHPSPGKATSGGRSSSGGSPPKRSKKQSVRRAVDYEREGKSNEPGSSNNCNPLVLPSAGDKNVTPLPGFQQAFGSTEIGKFSEAFFNSSPDPNDIHQDNQQHQHHHHHHHQHQQLMMDSLTACESDVDTLSPQPWEQPTGPGDPFDGSTGFNLQIGTSFHPSYYESPSYSSDQAVDSPLGNYFSEMTCNEFVN
ncbi:uncharacterized protein DDB_G0283357-like [Malaya genurostris]|uniref:uncharacterized protein DDB_G0283357-like n=1 Tax=Malaya genurostris TaxID=325434 RepID=UPI0026F40673|nr:uncharacterized protein DDB_G0283357-like [Malaya genurostris]XP_058466647.1 uncharacterized protein DDB_G0283357-like [Malaya genurostris]XP_058466648.1 uncharacterized protein DDB_G0283357-like [Malaya genurostris]XP_058466649.1 uncharacterized protein DDB_G0283357-like [Malaya genurostris]XP_058466650.1 uncharacterized protein DDB_G0283357-like [Malaya genurostris]